MSNDQAAWSRPGRAAVVFGRVPCQLIRPGYSWPSAEWPLRGRLALRTLTWPRPARGNLPRCGPGGLRHCAAGAGNARCGSGETAEVIAFLAPPGELFGQVPGDFAEGFRPAGAGPQ